MWGKGAGPSRASPPPATPSWTCARKCPGPSDARCHSSKSLGIRWRDGLPCAPRNEYSLPFIDYLFEFRKENPPHQRGGAPLELDGRGGRHVVGRCEPCIYQPRVWGSARSAARRSRWRRTAARSSASGRRPRRAYRTERLIAGRPTYCARHPSPRWARRATGAR